MTKIWITKYALTTGVFCVEATLFLGDGMARYRREGSHFDEYAHREGRDWHRTEAAAKARVEALRRKKIASLKKQIAKLEAL